LWGELQFLGERKLATFWNMAGAVTKCRQYGLVIVYNRSRSKWGRTREQAQGSKQGLARVPDPAFVPFWKPRSL
jgi:hypothetical protein